MELLNASMTHPVERPIKVIQFGEGNFLRGFVDYMIDIANEKELFDGNIVLIKPIQYGSLDMYHNQDCQYTLQLRGLVDGEKYVETRIIKSCTDAVSPFDDYQKYIDLAKIESLRFVVSNTTEAGIVFNENDSKDEKLNITFPGKLTQFLKARYDYFNGDASKGLIMLPVELIDDNGHELKRCVNKYMELWNMDEGFKTWVNTACNFTSTLVDRIVTGYPRDEKESICKELGYDDNILDTAEPFALWVIESEKDISKELPLDVALADKKGMNVIFTDNQKPYKQRKVRILNGAHTSFVLASYLAGNNIVKESMDDEMIRNFMLDTIYNEVIPTLDLPKQDLEDFAGAVVDRFKNPFIKHALLAISLNSVSKWRARCMPSLLGYVERKNTLPNHLVFSIAALMMFYNGTEIREGALIGHRNGEEYLIKDDAKVLEFFKENCQKPSKEFTTLYLGNTEFHGQDLNKVPGLTDAVSAYVEEIRTLGMRETLNKEFAK